MTTDSIKKAKDVFEFIFAEMGKVVVGQQQVIKQIIIAILTESNALLEGYPGLAKTLTVSTLSKLMDLKFSRIQGTPDLMPSDITGTYVLEETKNGREFKFQPGPVFSNVVLMDEINRATPKCVSEDTEVALGDGRIMSMKDVFARYNGKKTFRDGNERWVVPKKKLIVPSFNPVTLKIEPRRVKYLYKQITREPLCEVRLNTGHIIKTSPMHPFFTLDGSKVKTIIARHIKKGDFVLVPKKISIPGSKILNFDKNLLKETTAVKQEIKRRKLLYRKIRGLKHFDFSEIIRKLKIKNDADHNLIKTYLRRKPKYLDYPLTKDIFLIRSKQFGQVKWIRRPMQVTKDFAHFIALLLSEAYHNKQLHLDMKDKLLIPHFQKLLWNLFSYKVRILRSIGKKKRIALNSKTINKLLEGMGYNAALSRNKKIPDFIMQSNNTIVSEFLKIYFEAEGTIKRECVALTSASKEIINQLSYLLLRFGIVCHIGREYHKVKHGKNLYYILKIYGGNVTQFDKEIGFFGKRKTIKLARLLKKITGKQYDFVPNLHNELRNFRKVNGITHKQFYLATKMHAHNLENPKNRIKISKNILQNIYSLFKGKFRGGHIFKKLINGDFYCDSVKSIKQIKPNKPYAIYDFTIDKTHSFIAGFGGVISHNTQSALLEAMQERQVTVGNHTYKLEKPFFVLATQNPIEQEGTYPLPEAQSDRFLFKIKTDYPNFNDEVEIVSRYTEFDERGGPDLKPLLKKETIFQLQQLVRQIPIAQDIRKYAVELVKKTRERKELIEYGASPRASIGLVLAAKANALLDGRNYVTKNDVREMIYPILRHRIIINFEAERNNFNEDDVIGYLLK